MIPETTGIPYEMPPMPPIPPISPMGQTIKVMDASAAPEPPNEIVFVRGVWFAKSRKEMKRITKALEALGLKYTVEYFNDDKDYIINADVEGERQ